MYCICCKKNNVIPVDSKYQKGEDEVIEEDMALCEFVCTSKIDVQRVLSEGLELMAEES